MAEAIQKKLKSELEKYQEMQKDVSKSMSARHKLETQLTENNIVKEMWRLNGEGLASIISGWLVGTSYCTGAYFRILYKKELDLLDSENTVYKLIGPVLVKQDLDEAKATVSKRLEYINGEIQRYETLLKEMERKLDQHREVLSSLQQEYQRAQGRPVGKV